MRQSPGIEQLMQSQNQSGNVPVGQVYYSNNQKKIRETRQYKSPSINRENTGIDTRSQLMQAYINQNV